MAEPKPLTHFTPDIATTKGQGLTRDVAQFVIDISYDAIPADVMELGKTSILDGLGLALSGSVAESGALVERYLAELGLAGGPATVIGSSLKVPDRFAAFANGVAMHADDYDDTQLAVAKDRVYGLLTHPTAPVLPAVLAIAEARGLSGRELLVAYHAGVEVECKIAEAMSPRHYQHGFHSTATCGTLGAACAAGRIAGLDLDGLIRALAIGASQAGGLRENFGTMTKPFHAGRAAESGVVAARLAALGWTATDRILESPRGFFQAHAGGYDLDAIRGKLGNPWTFASPGVSIKPHPSGSLTHPGMMQMLELILEHDLLPAQVDRVRAGTNHNMLNALIHHRPTNALQAKFSMEFCLAILLLDRRAGLVEFTDAVVTRPDVQAMIEKVDVHVHPEAEAAGYDRMTTILEIRCTDGRTMTGRADFGRGSPAYPMSYDEVAVKFRGCAEFAGWPVDAATKVIEAVRDLDRLDDVRALTACLGREEDS